MPATTSRRRLDPRTRHLLATAHVDGAQVRIPDEVPPEEYAPVKDVLTALGGLWARSVRATVFPAGTDPARLIADTLTAGVMPLHPRRSEGFVRTPDDIADDLVDYPHSDLRWLPDSARILEPCAGDGALVEAILRAHPGVTVTAVEPNPSRAAVTATLGPRVTVHNTTLETFATTAISQAETFDAVIMNPPFAVPGDGAVWIEYLRLAWHLLRPGARLVAVVPNALTYRADSAHRDVRAFIDHHGTHQPLPVNAFAASGTTIATRVVRLIRPLDSSGLDHLFTLPDQAPVRVEEPRLTAEAVTTAPVQVWWDAWRRRDRVLRFRARCVRCGWLLWGFDDGENDPRGVLGDFTAGFSLDAADDDLTGPSVGLCCGCANDGDSYRTGITLARKHWSVPAPVLASV